MSPPRQPPDIPALDPLGPSPEEYPVLSHTPRPGLDSALSGISTSASSLLSSFTNPATPSTTSLASLASLASHSASAKSSHQQSHDSSSFTRLYAYSDSSSPSTSFSLGSTNKPQGIKSQPPGPPYSLEDEFDSFVKQPRIQLNAVNLEPPASPPNNHGLRRDIEDGLDVISLLSRPLDPKIYSTDLRLRGMNPTHPTIRSFAGCEDPVEFLSTTNEYVEEVWGDYAEVVQQAQNEILSDRKGKSKQDSGTATARLRMIWKHLRKAEYSQSL